MECIRPEGNVLAKEGMCYTSRVSPMAYFSTRHVVRHALELATVGRQRQVRERVRRIRKSISNRNPFGSIRSPARAGYEVSYLTLFFIYLLSGYCSQ